MFADIAGTELVDSETPGGLIWLRPATKSLLVAGPLVAPDCEFVLPHLWREVLSG